MLAVAVAWLVGQTVQGWASLATLILFIGGVQLLFLGVIGEYVGRIYSASKQRPLYVVDCTHGAAAPGMRPSSRGVPAMHEAEFDAHALTYRRQHAASVAFSGIPLDYFSRYKAEVARVECDRRQRRPGTVMDFGAGVGNAVPALAAAFPGAAIRCVDVSVASLALCARLGLPGVSVHPYDGRRLPFADGSIDLAFAACVFHHIPEAAHEPLLAEILRCLAPAGICGGVRAQPAEPAHPPRGRPLPLRRRRGADPLRRDAAPPGCRRVPQARGAGFRIFFPEASRAPCRPVEPWLEPVPARRPVLCRCSSADVGGLGRQLPALCRHRVSLNTIAGGAVIVGLLGSRSPGHRLRMPSASPSGLAVSFAAEPTLDVRARVAPCSTRTRRGRFLAVVGHRLLSATSVCCSRVSRWGPADGRASGGRDRDLRGGRASSACAAAAFAQPIPPGQAGRGFCPARACHRRSPACCSLPLPHRP